MNLDTIASFLSYIFAFLVILALAYFTTKIIATATFKKYRNRNMRLLEGLNLGPQKSLQLVKVGKKILLVGITKEHIIKLETFYPNELEFNEDDLDKNLLSFQEVFNQMTKDFDFDVKEKNEKEKNNKNKK